MEVTKDESRRMAERFRTALHLYELAEAMLRQKLRRTHPHASPDEIDALVARWQEHRPGAEHGDCVGRLRPWPPARGSES